MHPRRGIESTEPSCSLSFYLLTGKRRMDKGLLMKKGLDC